MGHRALADRLGRLRFGQSRPKCPITGSVANMECTVRGMSEQTPSLLGRRGVLSGLGGGAALAMATATTATAAATTVAPTAMVAATTTDPVLHMLRRATFGPTPALVSEVRATG